MPESPYSQNFDPSREPIRNSARLVVPIVLDLLQPRSVCDVGCASGIWLNVFQEHGIADVCGVDGEGAKIDNLEIPEERFVVADLHNGLELDRRFDLAVCLEVAEHLSRNSGVALVDGLVGLAPAVLFSAAAPGQAGAGHVNQRWPDYWAAHFERHGYVAVDCIRPRIWNEPKVRPWYAQNTILFVEESLLDSRPQLRREYERSKDRQLSVVHPRMLARAEKNAWIELARLVEARRAGEISEEQFQETVAARSSPEVSPLRAGGADEYSEEEFEARLQSLDTGLLYYVPSETTGQDKVSFLALHNACRESYGTFKYLEIGSHLGGSLQALIADERCTSITSIDARPLSQPDARGKSNSYPGNSTERMLAYLRRVPGANLAKLHTVDASTEDLAAATFAGAAQLCLIDAEHTHEGALRDARFCRGVVGEEGAIAFHDRRVIRGAIEEFIAELDEGSVTAYPLLGSVFVVELGPPRLANSEWVARFLPQPGKELKPAAG